MEEQGVMSDECLLAVSQQLGLYDLWETRCFDDTYMGT